MKKVLFLTLYFASPLLLIAVIFTSNTTKYTDMTYFVPMSLGALAYTWLCFEFILSARPRMIERVFGLDRFYRFHGLMAVVSVILAFMHKTIIEGIMRGGQMKEYGEMSLNIFIGIVVLALVMMADTLILKIQPLKKLRQVMTKNVFLFRYSWQVAIHNFTVVAISLLLLHVQLSSGAKLHAQVRAMYFVYFGLGLGFYLYHRAVRPLVLRRNPWRVAEIITHNPGMTSLRLEPENGRKLDYQPGQFAFLRLFSPALPPEEHPFSISSSPHDDRGITLTIKNLGDYTSRIRHIQPGARAWLDAPYGRLSYQHLQADDGVVMIAGGVGITPMLGNLRHMAASEPQRHSLLLWGVTTRSDLMLEEEFSEMENTMPGFRMTPVMFRDPEYQGVHGVVDRQLIETQLRDLGRDPAKQQYMICGPAVMMNSIRKELKALGIPRNRIHFESFSL